MTTKELYEMIKDYEREDVPLKIINTTETGSHRIDVEPENTSVYHDEVIIYI